MSARSSGRTLSIFLDSMRNYPHIQLVAIDYDPDISFANIENRLQMLIIAAREKRARKPGRPIVFTPLRRVGQEGRLMPAENRSDS